jgi:lipopolysaccharide transport system ATP-binding protein
MSDTVIRVENLSKKYIIRHQQAQQYTALRDVIADGFRSVGRRLSGTKPDPSMGSTQEEFWALKDVSFEVKQGDRIGIIGRNGAGKSTLLKILSRITEPTSGEISIRGRVASLLEVGTGFHPELSGRENIFLNGAILGMEKAEIKKKFDEIVEFAEVEKFIDTPVKHYSSGMYVRLAFAVAAHLEPEILIVDEVLAVGDAAFQKKCLGKIEDVSNKEGRTVLFVSHNMAALKSLCNESVWLENGNIKGRGETGEVISKYLTVFTSVSNENIWNNPKDAPGNEKVKWHRVCIRPLTREKASPINVDTSLVAEFECWNYSGNTNLNFSLHLFSIEGIKILNTFSSPQLFSSGLIKGTCYIPAHFLNDQTYYINIMLVEGSSRVLHELENALIFKVNDTKREVDWYGKWEGLVRPKLNWEVTSAQQEK